MTVRFERQALTVLNDEWIDTFHICKKIKKMYFI